MCRSEEHTSELQSLTKLVCRLLLEKKKKKHKKTCSSLIHDTLSFPPCLIGYSHYIEDTYTKCSISNIALVSVVTLFLFSPPKARPLPPSHPSPPPRSPN